MTFGLVLLIFGGFLLGGTWSVWQSGQDEGRPRSGPQIALAAVILIAALLATVAGILYLV
ncbi:hypothetical protein [Blastococcus sp. TF02A-30]|uniref:hypothetical protein n=1 Tax=Blastococcus sp. TF02A-30 TaxID=2250580 RepID=UPI000DE85DF1|nr:hypothetical protein [Blastococcus sp. TF02A-30]RBY85612.1 hypothetical protein DQ241_14990 [Blastococcus sp. TF02A-30]